jgi:hypothetical protein
MQQAAKKADGDIVLLNAR